MRRSRERENLRRSLGSAEADISIEMKGELKPPFQRVQVFLLTKMVRNFRRKSRFSLQTPFIKNAQIENLPRIGQYLSFLFKNITSIMFYYPIRRSDDHRKVCLKKVRSAPTAVACILITIFTYDFFINITLKKRLVWQPI